MKPDKWGARADYEYDQMIEARWLRHQDGECDGSPMCAWCLDSKCCNGDMEDKCQQTSKLKP